MQRIVSILLIFLVATSLIGQSTNEKLAAQFFDNDEFDKALPLYQDLADDHQDNLYFYDRYLACLLETKNFDKAEKFVHRRARKNSQEAQYAIDIGFVFTKAGKNKEAEKAWQKTIDNLDNNYNEYLKTAGAFQKRLEYSWAIKVYEKGEKQFEGVTDFSSQLAILYMETGNREKGLEKYIGIALQSGLGPDQYMQIFEMNITDSADFAVLRTILLRYIQKMPDNFALAGLLKWTYVKQKDWGAAFIQTRALDKRLKEDGLRVIELGDICMSNEAWDVAAKCFEYAKSIGKTGAYYHEAVNGLLETSYNQIVLQGSFDSALLKKLESEYISFLTDQGYSDYTWRSVSRLAEIYTSYTHENDKAIQLLEEYIKTPGLRKLSQAKAKLQLGDVYVIDGDVWSSELLYAQVELDFAEEATGQEAKFRRARLSYFRGDFEWAGVQLSVLKGATTQLISNNAIELALTISENIGIDSNYDALEMYARSELLVMQNKLKDADFLMDSIPIKYPGHSLSDDILYNRAKIREKQGKYAEAIDLYETLVIAFGHDILADNGWFQLGLLYENRMHNKEKALEAFQKIIFNFPGSIYNVEARKHYRRLRGDNV